MGKEIFESADIDVKKENASTAMERSAKRVDMNRQVISDDHDAVRIEITGYTPISTVCLPILILFSTILSGGIFLLFLYWWPILRLKLTHVKCSIQNAKTILIEERYSEKYSKVYVKEVKEIQNSNHDIVSPLDDILDFQSPTTGASLRYFRFKKSIYVWFESEKNFVSLNSERNGWRYLKNRRVIETEGGLSETSVKARQRLLGSNEIVVPIHTIFYLLLKEFLTPFYVFQVFALTFWFLDGYIYYAATIGFLSLTGIIASVIQTRQNEVKLHSTIQTCDVIKVFRLAESVGGCWKTVSTEDLVPGDLIEIPSHGCDMHCDALILSGTAITNESMLTGESVPLTKNCVDLSNEDGKIDLKMETKSMLFRGTKVIQTRNYRNHNVTALVLRTGFSTSKGRLVASILYPEPADFKFDQDSYKFITALGILAFIGFTYTSVTQFLAGEGWLEILAESIDLITIVVPPALPMAMTVGCLYALKRLVKKKIFCISPRAINVSGSVDCVCFDKTGTLTEDGLDMKGVFPVVTKVNSSTNDENVSNTSDENCVFERFETFPQHLSQDEDVIRCMATCHSLSVIDNKIEGDPLDLSMFKSTGWKILHQNEVPQIETFDSLFSSTIVRPSDSGKHSEMDIGIVKQFPFTSSEQSMSVVTRGLKSSNFSVYCKGSPSKIRDICRPNSIPDDFDSVLFSFTSRGNRVIGIAAKHLESSVNIVRLQGMRRIDFESKLTFLGFIVMENRLKRQTRGTLRILVNEARLHVAMVTGDDINTGICVARDSNLVDENTKLVQVTLNSYNSLKFDVVKMKGCSTSVNIGSTTTHGGWSMLQEETDELSSNFNVEFSASKNFINSLAIKIRNVCDSVSITSSVKSQGKLDSFDDFRSRSKERCENTVERGEESRNREKEKIRFAMEGDVFTRLMAILNNNKKKLKSDENEISGHDEMRRIIEEIVVGGAVFARMKPKAKEMLINYLKGVGFCVAMCGDGANDCGALRSAHAGISLSSEAESSIASPFTSQRPNISCIPELIRQGRCALVTSFGVFKYMALYSLTQFISVLILYSIDSNLTDIQYLYIDLFLISVFAFYFGKTQPSDGPLAPYSPPKSLISPESLSSVVLHLITVIFFQFFTLLYLNVFTVQEDIATNSTNYTEKAYETGEWFIPFNSDNPFYSNTSVDGFYKQSGISEEVKWKNACFENYAVFGISAFQYITLALVLSKSKPFRKPFTSNLHFSTSIIVMTLFTMYLIVDPTKFLRYSFELLIAPTFTFRFTLIIIAVVNFIIAFIIEDFLVDHLISKYLKKTEFIQKRLKTKKVYLAIKERLNSSESGVDKYSSTLNLSG